MIRSGKHVAEIRIYNHRRLLAQIPVPWGFAEESFKMTIRNHYTVCEGDPDEKSPSKFRCTCGLEIYLIE